MRFENKAFLVTGGAMGIGAATVRRLASEGGEVIIADRDEEASGVVAAETGSGPGRVEFVRVDLSDQDSITEMGRAVAGGRDVLHGLVNNAGVAGAASVEKSDDKTWDLQVATNMRAPLLCTQALLPLLKAGPGHIVNVSSEGAFRPRPNNIVYDATKAAICAFTRTMASEFAEHGMRVNTVAPGWTVTEMHVGRGPDAEERRARLESIENKGCILNRVGRPEEIAAAIAFLLSDDASYITASTLHVDGGRVGN